jgi:AcrR family transcriptional regulator
MADVVAADGYAATSVSDVIAAAGVSRATFYEQFADKLDCFLAAFDAASEHVLAASDVSMPEGATFAELLTSYLDVLADNAAFAKVFLVDIYAAGPAGVARRAAGQQRFAAVVASVFDARSAADRFACDALVAAISVMVTARLAADDVDGLRALHRPLLEFAQRLFPPKR